MGHRETDRASAAGKEPGTIYQDGDEWVLVTEDTDQEHSCGAECCGYVSCRLLICDSLAEAEEDKRKLGGI